MKYPDDDYQGNEISKAFNINENYALHILRIVLRGLGGQFNESDRAYFIKRFGTDRCGIADSNEPLPYNVEHVSMEEIYYDSMHEHRDG